MSLSSDGSDAGPLDSERAGGRPTHSPEGEPLLACEGLVVHLGDSAILRGIQLAVPAGSVLGVLGPSGAGKSTLFRTLAGELTPVAGRVLLGGRDVTQLPLWVRARLGLGYVPQTPSVLFDLTVEKNLKSFVKLAGAAWSDAERLAEQLGLGARMRVRASELSGGERRRLELARALLGQPRVLVCDEPLSGLDPNMVHRVGVLFRELAARGSAVILADHRIAEVLPVCEAALLLVDGRVLLESAAANFIGHPAVQERYLT